MAGLRQRARPAALGASTCPARVFGRQGQIEPQLSSASPPGGDGRSTSLATPTIDAVRYSNVWDLDLRLAKNIKLGAATGDAERRGVQPLQQRHARPQVEPPPSDIAGPSRPRPHRRDPQPAHLPVRRALQLLAALPTVVRSTAPGAQPPGPFPRSDQTRPAGPLIMTAGPCPRRRCCSAAAAHRAQRRPRHHRHPARRPRRRLRLPARRRRPTLDRLAREGVLLEDAVVQVPADPALARVDLHRPLPVRARHPRQLLAAPRRGTPTLATVLRAPGLGHRRPSSAPTRSRAPRASTGASPSSTIPSPAGDATTREARTERPRGRGRGRGARLARAAARRGRFFAWVHLFDPHAPYDAAAPYRRRASRRAPTTARWPTPTPSSAGSSPGSTRTGLREPTLVVVTSDHGEGLGDHGEDEHMLFVYDSTLHVPLVLSLAGPAARGRARRGPVPQRRPDARPCSSSPGVPAPPTSGASRAARSWPGGQHPRQRVLRGEPLRAAPLRLRAPARAARRGLEVHRRPAQPSSTASPRTPARRGTSSRSGPGRRRRCAARSRPTTGSRDRAELPSVRRRRRRAPRRPRLRRGGAAAGRRTLGRRPQGHVRRGAAVSARHARGRCASIASGTSTGRSASSSRAGAQRRRRRSTSSTTSAAACSRARRFAEAIPHLEKAAEMAPTRRTLSGLAAAPIYAYLVEAYAGAGQSRRRFDTLEQALEVAPDNAELLAGAGPPPARAGRPRPGPAAALEKARRSPRASRGSTWSCRTSTATSATSPGPEPRPREALRLDPSRPRPTSRRPRPGSARPRGRGGARRFARPCASRPSHPDALFYLARWSCARGAPRRPCPCSRSSRGGRPTTPSGRETLELARKMAQARAPGAAAPWTPPAVL